MTPRRSDEGGLNQERVAERRLRLSDEAGRFDGLAGARRPLRRFDGPHDQDWWIKEMLRRVPIGLLVRLPGEVEVGRRPSAPSTSTLIGVDVTVAASSNASTVRSDHRVLS